MKIRALRIVQLTLLLLLMQLPLHAQVYPVQVVSQLLPPYTLNVSDYYQGTQEKLVVLLTNTDLTKPTLQVKLKMSIQGQNAKLRTREGGFFPPITLDGGAPQRITLADLAPYFNVDNLELEGITRNQFQQSQKLPEGFYQFCFEAYEYNTNRLVGRSHCTMAWISLLDPPLLNLPRKSESIAYKDPVNIVFQWTPRNMGSPTAAFNTEYEFTLVELWDNGIAPEAAFGTMQPLYRTTTQATTLLYGPAEPLLIPGKRYGWRIRAQASNGSQSTDGYRNNGYSEIYWFTYQRDCPMPFNLHSEVSSGRATITWNAALQQTRFVVDYREKGQTASQWYTVNGSTNRVMLYDLKQDKQYEYRVGAYCDGSNEASFPASGAVYSDIKNFTIEGSSIDTAGGGCNILQPELKVANRDPIQNLMSGDMIRAGDFPVKLITVQGQGNFTGTGYITIPFIGKVNVKVRFANITVNTDKQLISGVIETTYDKEAKQLVDVNEFTGDPSSVGILNDLKDNIPDPDKAPLDDLIDFAEKLSEVSESTIDNALALTSAEKTQLKQNIATMNDTREVLEDSSATPQQRAEAEQKLRDAVKQAAPIVQKLAETVGRGVQSVVSNWFNNVREFLKGYRGTQSDKQQATQWHKSTDSLVAILKQSKNVPNSLLDSLDKATQAATPAWIALESATSCNSADNTQAAKGPYMFEDVMNDYSCYVALGNAQYNVIERVQYAAQNNLFNTEKDLVIEKAIIQESPTGIIVYTPDGKKYQVEVKLSKYTVDINGALSSFTYDGAVYVACYFRDKETKKRIGFACYAKLEKIKAILNEHGTFNLNKAKSDGYVYEHEKLWKLLKENADKVEMMQNHFDRNGSILMNDTGAIRKEILALMEQLPAGLFRIVKDDQYIQFYDQVKLRDHLREQVYSVDNAMARIQALISAYHTAKGTRTSEQLQEVYKAGDPIVAARCKITKELEGWDVAMVKYSADRPALSLFEQLSQTQRLDLLKIMYELPTLTTSATNESGFNCYHTYFGEEIVIALMKYAPDQDKAAIIGYFKTNPKVLPRFYQKIDNKSILPDDHNFDNFIRELIKANAVYLATGQSKPSDAAQTILWSYKNSVDLIKGVTFNSAGNVLFRYVKYDINSTSIILPIMCGPLGTLVGFSVKQSEPVDPLATVNLVIPEPDSKYWPELTDPAKFPYTIQIPAVSAAWMINKTTNDRIQLGVDIALIALSAGEYAAAKGALQYLWVSAQIAFPLANEIIQHNPDLIRNLYGAYDRNKSPKEREELLKKADAFISNYNTFATLVDLGAMGAGMYSLYKDVRGGVDNMRALGIDDKSDIMSKMEADLNKIDSKMPEELQLGQIVRAAGAETALTRKLATPAFSKLNGKIDELKELKQLFMTDFANASDDVLHALQKDNSELLESWKKFREKYSNDILCN